MRPAVKGANTRVVPVLGVGWNDRRCGFVVPLPRVQGPAGRGRPMSPWAGRQGPRAAGPAPRARGTAAPGGTAATSCRGSRAARGDRPAPATLGAQCAPGHPADAAALASGAGAQEMAAAARPAWAPLRASRGAGRGAADGTRESALGPSADQRRAWQTRLASIALDGPSAARPPRAWAGPADVRARLARVPARPGGEHRRLRLLHRRERAPAPLLRVVLHRARKPARGLLAARPTRPAPGSPSRHATSA